MKLIGFDTDTQQPITLITQQTNIKY
jgi:hypothetical protein